MITVESEDVAQLLNILENVVRSGHWPSKEEIDSLLSTKWISFMTGVYSMLPGFSKEGLADVLADLAGPQPVAQGLVLSKLEEGFRSCLSVERINSLRKRLQGMMALDYAKAEHMALQYLPPGTPITSTIYLSIDAINPGMTFGGNVSLSILAFDPESFDFPYLAHELHHLGFRYWIEKNPKLSGFALRDNRDHREIAVNMILHLLSEGLANYYLTPSFVRTHASVDKEHNRKIKKYEESLGQMLLEIQSLLSDCVSESLSVEKCRERLLNLIFDQEGILPPVHFIGAHIMEMFDEELTIKRQDIIDLCKNPSEFFAFYSRTHDRYGLPGFSKDVVNQVSSLLGSA
jgi:hypothetical protein